MRIGILTLPLHTNYGGILQAYALQTVLERMGHDVVVFDTPRVTFRLPLWKKPLVYGKRLIKKYVMGNKSTLVFFERKINRDYPVAAKNTQRFISQYIHAKHVSSLGSLNAEEFDAIVVGSDQIWRPKYYPKIENAYLEFAKHWNIKRIAYAASFGTDKWEYTPKQTMECSRLIRKFDGVSVREDSAVGLCREHFGVEVKLVLDPTMLLDKEDYIKLFTAANTPKSKGTLLCYVLDETPEKSALIQQIADERHLTPFRVNSRVEDHSAPLNERIQPPVEQWLRGFYDAEFVVTDSFHACVFSILFGKQFLVVGNESRGLSRFNSLLKMFGLEDRLVTKDFRMKDCAEIDYSQVYQCLKGKRETSMNFLVENLK